MIRRRIAPVPMLLLAVACFAGPAAASSLRLTTADLDAVLQEDDSNAVSLPSIDNADTAPRRWWPIALSAILPGLGEVSTGNNRGIPMIAVDAAIWWGVYSKQQDGNDLEKEFEAFALEHWSEEKWTQALANGDLVDFFPAYDSGTLPEDVPLYVPRDVDEREWFENAGKWDDFAWGWREFWDDTWNATHNADFIGADFYAPQVGLSDTWFFADNATMTPLRKQYIEMRDESNSAYQTRDTLLSAALLLRVFSVLQMVYLEGFVGRRYDAAEPALGLAAPQGAWSAQTAVSGSGLVAWRMTW
jgi:hypothetical protein